METIAPLDIGRIGEFACLLTIYLNLISTMHSLLPLRNLPSLHLMFSFFFLILFGASLYAQTPLHVSHWTNSNDPDLSTGTAGSVSQITLDSTCSQIRISIADPVNTPLPPFNAYEFNPLDSMGNEITDLSGNMRIYVRARSLDTVRLALLLRSGGGSSAERSDRVEVSIPGDLSNWSEYVFEFSAANLAGFDSTDFRDIWFYLDRGDNNFAGNEFYFDYISIGAAPDSATFSTCTASPPPPVAAPLYALHWGSASDPLFSGNAATTLTQQIDSACSQVALSVTAPLNTPLGGFSALILNPKDSAGMELVDLSGNLRFFIRARSKDPVMLGLLLRSGDGSAPFRTLLQEQLVPGDTTVWSDLSFVVDASNLGGFDSTDLRDIWIYLDRGTDNFAGNAFFLDYLTIGNAPDTALNSTCASDSIIGNDTTTTLQYALHWATAADPVLSGSAAATLTQTVDTLCSQLAVSVTDPVGNPLSSFGALIINPKDSLGADIVDLSGNAKFHVRVRSQDSVRLGFLARSGDGTSSFRSVLQEQWVPGDTLNWTELTFALDTASIGGFDSTDLRDIWFYLDQGTDNFAGNEFYFDFIAMGEKPDAADNSPCSLLPPFDFPYLLHWADTLDGVFTGSGAAQLTETVDTACSQLLISVTDPVGDPHAAFRPLIVNPQDGFGNDLQDLSGQMRFYVRVRSASTVLLGMTLRSGEGLSNERTGIVEQVVPGGLDQWTELVYTFTGADYGGFDSTDLRDFWFYLDREEANFNGNEFYFDYVSIGSKPDASDNSDCVQLVGISEELPFQDLKIYPNPSQGDQALQLAFYSGQQQDISVQVFDIRGQLMWQESFTHQPGMQQHPLQSAQWTPGLYLIQVTGEQGQSARLKWMLH